MTIKYLPIHFYCSFKKTTIITTNLTFILRSMLGANLRKMCCASPKSACKNCMFNKTCIYYSFFDTPINKNNKILNGRESVSHPFAITQNSSYELNKPLQDFDFTITLFGNAIDYLPYIYTAFLRAGEDGLLEQRSPYIIRDVTVDDNSILKKNEIDTSVVPMTFTIEPKRGEIKSGEILVRLLSPLRYECQQEITSDIFFRCLFRRLRIMMEMYGNEYEDSHLFISETNTIKEKHINTVGYRRYSSRQKHTMTINGLLGSITLEGTFSDFELSLLEFAKIANAGKNTNFGYGQMDYWTRF